MDRTKGTKCPTKTGHYWFQGVLLINARRTFEPNRPILVYYDDKAKQVKCHTHPVMNTHVGDFRGKFFPIWEPYTTPTKQMTADNGGRE